MKDSTLELLARINEKEQNFLQYNNFSSAFITNLLKRFGELRGQLYDEFREESEDFNMVKSASINEYQAYCKFIFKFVVSKKLSNAEFSTILQSFVDDYEIVKWLDQENTLSQLTIATLNHISESLKNAKVELRNERSKILDGLINVFIDNKKNENGDTV